MSASFDRPSQDVIFLKVEGHQHLPTILHHEMLTRLVQHEHTFLAVLSMHGQKTHCFHVRHGERSGSAHSKRGQGKLQARNHIVT